MSDKEQYTESGYCVADYPHFSDKLDRTEQALDMMQKWFSDQMTKNQVGIINVILNGGKGK